MLSLQEIKNKGFTGSMITKKIFSGNDKWLYIWFYCMCHSINCKYDDCKDCPYYY